MSPRSRRRRAVASPEDALGTPARRDRPPPPTTGARSEGRRRLGLGMWIALLAGAQIGRASVALPEGLSYAAGIVIALGLALTLTMAYRRWARRAMADARARRGSNR